MDEKKNIDRLFQEKFKDFEAVPDASIWNNIESQLMKKKKRRILPLWFRFTGAAAILLLLVSSGFWYLSEDKNTLEQPQEIIITDSDTNEQTREEKSSDKLEGVATSDEQKGDIELINQEEYRKVNSNQPKKKNAKFKRFVNQLNNAENETKISSYENEKRINFSPEKIAIQTESEKLIETETKFLSDALKDKSKLEKTSIAQEEVINQPEKAKDVIQQELEKIAKEKELFATTRNKWSIGSTMSPIYYNTLSNGSPIDPELASNKKNSKESISYGLKVNYKLSNKFSLQSGINTVELGYSTENVAALVSSSLLSGSNTNVNSNIDGITVATISTTNSQNSDFINQRSSFDVSGNLDQSLNYIEIPLEAKYNILQKKLGINLIGGFSTYFLYGNEVVITSFGKTTALGEASNINSLNFSGNLGIDLDYNISKKIYINVSPMFKYQFNTFSKNPGGFQPYYLGIYTGLNFRF